MSIVSFFGRILISMVFIVSALMKFFAHTQQVEYAMASGLPMAGALVWVAAVIELIFGVGILIGYHVKISAWVLFLYLIPVTLTFHYNFLDPNQFINFLKNLAIMGGLLQIARFGTGESFVRGGETLPRS